ncbi:MAG: peptide chain release factor N(5)-glutamine methyltransferase [Methylococcaceae bacterium]|nr:MAG: peptide chain release factor N(5)-glutamine methyltransferase [Methylococcaceae bacterium]
MHAHNTIKPWLRHAHDELLETSETPWPDAEILLAWLLEKPRTYLYAWPERPLEPDQIARYDQLIARRKAGEPVAYLTGRREFWSREFQVTRDVLIPRPETELLVELALAHIHSATPEHPFTVADLGTGSGAIAITIALECPGTTVVAGDISEKSLGIARSNAERLGAKNVEFYLSDWLDGLPPQRFDVIVSNPPYIPEHDPYLSKGDLRFEPAHALVSGNDGLHAIRRIAAAARQRLQAGGALLLEHGYDQAAKIQAMLHGLGYAAVSTHRDLAGLDRVTMGKYYWQEGNSSRPK